MRANLFHLVCVAVLWGSFGLADPLMAAEEGAALGRFPNVPTVSVKAKVTRPTGRD